MRARELLLMFTLFLAVAVVMTWPLVTTMTGALPYDPRFEPFTGSDMNTWAWNFWWARSVAENGSAPFRCDMIFPPFGHSLALHTHTFLWGLFSVPFQWAGGLVFAVNAMVLMLLAAAATSAYALARELALRPLAAGLAGFAWGFSPYFLQKGLVHFNLFASPWMPLAVLFALRWMRVPRGERELGPPLGLGLVVGLSLLTGMLQTVYLAASVLGFLLVTPRSPGGPVPRRAALLGPASLALALVAFTATALPFLVEWIPEWSSLAGRGDYPQEFHPRLADFFRPSGLHPMFAGLGAAAPVAGAPFAGLRPEHSALYLRFSLLALALVGIVRVPVARRLGLLFLLLFLVAWDPGPEPEGWLSSLYRSIPPLGLLRVPARFLPAAMLPLALAAAVGFQELLRSSTGGRIGVVLACLVAFESWSAPYPSAEVRIPRAVLELESVPRDGVVLKLPHLPGASVSMLWQTRHGLPAALSYVARTNPAVIAQLRTVAPDLSVLTERPEVLILHPNAPGTPSLADIAIDLRRLNIRHILVHEADMADPSQLYSLLDDLEGWEEAAEAGDGVTRWYATR